ncbi:MAG: FAD-binding protein [Velocimicrobium sp.]
MRFLKFNVQKCNLCGDCIQKCPFQALSMEEGGIEVLETCKMCGVCIKSCKQEAIQFEQKAGSADKGKWKDILIYVEQENGAIHPVTYELIGEAKKLAQKVNYQVKAIIVGTTGTRENAKEILSYGVDRVFVYEHSGFDGFRADCYTDAVADCIASIHPSIVLIGATALGRSLAPRLSTRFHTGLTADCTKLDIRSNTDLVQIRPAFGGNIMAQILITDARPQFATVRYKVMETAKKVKNPTGTIELCPVSDALAHSRIDIVEQTIINHVKTIEEEDVLLVAGRGVKKERDFENLEKLADLLGGQVCFTRPMVEAGYGDMLHQIGLSGRTVKPKLILTFGVSGAIQFVAGMNHSECIIAIDNNPEALIFKTADYCMVEDVSAVLPRLVEKIANQQEVR